MKKGTIILGSILGGAILGTAVTLCLTSKSGKDVRRMAHEKILAHLEHLHDHIKGCGCMMGGECDCECGDSIERVEKAVSEKMGEMKDKVTDKLNEVKNEVKGKSSEMLM